MPNWFYYDENGEKTGPISSVILKTLADLNKITQETVIETEDGRRGKAGQVRGLFSAGGRTAPHNSTQSDSSGSDRQSQPESSSSIQRWFFYDANGVKQGPLTDEQIKSFIDSGIINRNTELETLEGLRGKAGNVKKFFPNMQVPPTTVFQSHQISGSDLRSRLMSILNKYVFDGNDKIAVIISLSFLLLITILATLPFYDGKSADELYELGNRYYFGEGVEPNEQKAFELIKESANKGSLRGQSGLGMIYYLGLCSVKQDYNEAFKWFEKAALKGDPNGQYGLGECYEHGAGVTANQMLAKAWKNRAAAQGHEQAVQELRNQAAQEIEIQARTNEKRDKILREISMLRSELRAIDEKYSWDPTKYSFEQEADERLKNIERIPIENRIRELESQLSGSN